MKSGKRVIAVLALCFLLVGTMLPSSAMASGRWHHGYHGGWWWPGAVIGGIVLGAAAIVTAPFWALAAPPAYAPPVTYAPPMVSAPPVAYAPPTYAAPRPAPPPSAYPPPPPAYQASAGYAPPPPAPAVQREVVYPHGRYVLYGDGVQRPWQWVWVPAVPLPPVAPAP